MPCINLDLDYLTHPKTVRLVGIIGEGAEVYPIRLWIYCGKYHVSDGVLEGYLQEEIEGALRWTGEKLKLVDALVRSGYLDVKNDLYSAHDWKETQGHLMAFHKRAKQANKIRWSKIIRTPTRIPKVNVKESPVPTVPTVPTIKVKRPQTDPVNNLLKLLKTSSYEEEKIQKSLEKLTSKTSKSEDSTLVLHRFLGGFGSSPPGVEHVADEWVRLVDKIVSSNGVKNPKAYALKAVDGYHAERPK